MTNTESISRRLLRLPSFIGLSEAQQRRVAAAIYEFFAVPMA
jgi:dTDP-4-amino-4,6-dideoxygalactose transaminase